MIFQQAYRVYTLQLDADGRPPLGVAPQPHPTIRATGFSMAMTPDGQLLAYDRIVGDRRNVYIRTFPNGADLQVGEGMTPRWLQKDGRLELYFLTGPEARREMSMVLVEDGQPRTVQHLFDLPEDIVLDSRAREFDVSPEGFLLVEEPSYLLRPVIELKVVRNLEDRLAQLFPDK